MRRPRAASAALERAAQAASTVDKQDLLVGRAVLHAAAVRTGGGLGDWPPGLHVGKGGGHGHGGGKPAKVVDLMDALRQSLDRVKTQKKKTRVVLSHPAARARRKAS